jgi:hypothetical protein
MSGRRRRLLEEVIPASSDLLSARRWIAASKTLEMPDISKHAAVLQGLMSGTYRTLGLSISSHNVTPGLKIAKRGKWF